MGNPGNYCPENHHFFQRKTAVNYSPLEGYNIN